METPGFFHKLKIGFMRVCAPSIPRPSDAKKYSNSKEEELVRALQARLPGCKIKRNILVQTAEGKAEIDCLVLFENKMFAIEMKSWKGRLSEHNQQIIHYKMDRWTGKIHIRRHKSPFKQLGRAIYLLKKQIPSSAWIYPIVFFSESKDIHIKNDQIWFDDIENLCAYIHHANLSSRGNAEAFFNQCVTSDFLYCKFLEKSLRCVICEESLWFQTPQGLLTRHEIQSISITHHWWYDELHIKTKQGTYVTMKEENASVVVMENGRQKRYALCKLDAIRLENL